MQLYNVTSFGGLTGADLEISIKKLRKESRDRPGVAQRVSGGLDTQIPMTFG
jgi:hypothetical protein